MLPRLLLVAGVAVLSLAACDEINPGLGPYEAPGGPDVVNREAPGDIAIPGEGETARLNQEMIKQGQQRAAEGLMP